MKDMTFDELASLPESDTGRCFLCKDPVTESNRAKADQVHDGKLYPLCQNCYRLDDVVPLDKLMAEQGEAPEASEGSP